MIERAIADIDRALKELQGSNHLRRTSVGRSLARPSRSLRMAQRIVKTMSTSVAAMKTEKTAMNTSHARSCHTDAQK